MHLLFEVQGLKYETGMGLKLEKFLIQLERGVRTSLIALRWFFWPQATPVLNALKTRKIRQIVQRKSAKKMGIHSNQRVIHQWGTGQRSAKDNLADVEVVCGGHSIRQSCKWRQIHAAWLVILLVLTFDNEVIGCKRRSCGAFKVHRRSLIGGDGKLSRFGSKDGRK